MDVTIVRVGLVVFGLASGVGVAAYFVAWLVLPLDGDPETIASRAVHDRTGLASVAGLVPVLAVALLLARATHAGWINSVAWPLAVAAGGVVLVWRNGSEDDRLLLRRAAEPLMALGGNTNRRRRGLAIRLAAGVLIGIAGVAVLTAERGAGPVGPLGGVVLLLAAVVVVFGPWWLNVARELVDERQARLRAEERADLASRVHDSVLQTLAMIQRHAGDPQRVSQLARAQERELRSWLWEGQLPGSFGSLVTTVGDAVRRIQADVEAAHGVKVEVVAVGDALLSPDLEPILAAGREATVNAAKWSGADSVSLFLEVEPVAVSLFVRDRGRGFDRSAVAADRRGVSESIEGRMARAGGTAVIRTAPSGGTEVALRIPRRPGDGAGTPASDTRGATSSGAA